jgi:hypothetical protein
MLEGQVAVLSTDVLDAEEALDLLRRLRASSLYTARQHSYLLYPNRKLPAFIDRNIIPSETIAASTLLAALKASGDTQLIECDAKGNAYFAGHFTNTASVRGALKAIARQGFEAEVAAESDAIESLFSTLFDCATFTGRSGGMYAYEGLGSIYWHMVSKLLLAVLDTVRVAEKAGCSGATMEALIAAYYDVREGIGFNKTPDVYGAFPTDPYSHTPGFAGARQPGMTGQVKEEVLTRLGELGVQVNKGQVAFKPTLLRDCEFLTDEGALEYVDVQGAVHTQALKPSQLGFTYCQVPVVYSRAGGDDGRVMVTYANGDQQEFPEGELDADVSASLFMKLGDVARIDVAVAKTRS